MAIKFVYALISSENDYYVEQAAISMHTLRAYNPGCHITLVANDDTLDTLTGNRSLIKNYVDEYVSVNPPAEFTPTQKNRFLKTTLRQNVEGDFLYVDNDTVITGSLKELDDLDCEMGAVLDHHTPLENNNQLKDYLRKTKKEFWNYNLYFNGGVLFVRDTENTHKLFEDWHSIWDEDRIAYGISIDQPAFAQANARNKYMISEINGIYNCQLFMPKASEYVYSAKLIHYYANSRLASRYPFTDERLLKMVREQGLVRDGKDIALNLLLNYLRQCFIVRGEELDLYNSPMAMFGRKLAQDYKWTNKPIRFIYRLFGYRL